MTRRLLVRGGWLMHLDGARWERADLLVDGPSILEVGPNLSPGPEDAVLDVTGRIVMPGLVVGHHHLYSALASTMPPPPRSPRNFHEILQLIWWRLDRALDAETTELSGLAGAIEAAACGVTTIVDHHASPSYIAGSLDSLRDGIAAVGQRGVLCYEVTERNNGAAERDAGLAENARFASANRGPFFSAMVGAHAAFTISDEGLRGCADLAKKLGVPVHIHVAEDPCDDAICRSTYGAPLMDRLERADLLRAGNVLGHCTHLSPDDVAKAAAAGCRFAHNTRSNMNNGVGYAPLASMAERTQLGTDGIGSDMFEEFRSAVFRSNDGHTGLGWDALLRLLVNSADVAGESLGVRLGRLEPRAAADFVVLEPPPALVLGDGGVAGHLLFSLSRGHVRATYVAGECIWANGRTLRVSPEAVSERVARATPALWARLPAE